MIHTARRLRSWCKWQTSKRDLRWRSPTTWWTTYRSSSPTNLPWIVGIFLSSTSKFTAYVYSCTCWAFPTSWDPLVSWLSTTFSPRRRRRTSPRSTRCNWTQFPRYFMVSGNFAVDNISLSLIISNSVYPYFRFYVGPGGLSRQIILWNELFLRVLTLWQDTLITHIARRFLIPCLV